MKELIRRVRLVNYLHEVKHKNVFKVVTGIRRCGKSTLLKIFADELLEQGVEKQCIQQYNFEKPNKEFRLDWRDIYFHIESKLQKGKQNYVFIDEPQIIPEFERLLDGLFVTENVQLFVTGSNSELLSGELATLLTGRYIEIHVIPFSFQEYILAQNSNTVSDQVNIDKYIFSSSFPEVASENVGDSKFVLDYVNSVYATIIEKDIYPRGEVRNKRAFENVLKYLLANIGSEVSPTNIAKVLQSTDKEISHKTIANYIDILKRVYILYQVDRFDIRGKRQLETQEKYYVSDLGFRRVLVGRQLPDDIGHLLENVVYFELLRRGGKIWIGKNNRTQVDFVVQKPEGGVEYYQVAYTAKERTTLERELKPLQTIKDSYPKFLLTTDPLEFDDSGIKILNVEKWLREVCDE